MRKNIEVKFNEKRSKGSGDMEQTGNSMVNTLTLNCDLDLESAYVMLIVSLR